MKKENEEIIMYDDDRAARYVKDIEGWVSRNGLFFGNKEDAEHVARYSGCTHSKCNQCGKVIEKHYLKCDSCSEKNKKEKFKTWPIGEWDEKAMLYSQYLDKFYNDIDEVIEDFEEAKSDEDEKGLETLEDMMLVICNPVTVRYLEEDYFYDEMAEDSELPPHVKEAIDIFNESVKDTIISWEPSKTRLDWKKYYEK